MKKMVYLLITLFIIQFVLTGCPDKADDSYVLGIYNESDYDIAVYARLHERGTLYSDTTLPIKNWVRGVIKRGCVKPIELNLYEIDTFCLFILNQDTVEAYPWDTIHSRYMILKRYDLDRQKLKETDWTITYSE